MAFEILEAKISARSDPPDLSHWKSSFFPNSPDFSMPQAKCLKYGPPQAKLTFIILWHAVGELFENCYHSGRRRQKKFKNIMARHRQKKLLEVVTKILSVLARH